MSTNSRGLTRKDYTGAKSTLCSGCGHDSITNNLISSMFLGNVNPYSVAKLSGIGCSSKTPTYFLDKSSGFNSIHGRMAPVATGVSVANTNLNIIGVSGDGDSASIGIGGLVHLMRRNVKMVYIVENNGVYGLTKGQFSATADLGTTLKSGEANKLDSIDLCSMAVDLGCTFVARSFSGDAKQLVPLLQAAFNHHGTAFIDVISPCVTFANHEGSTKSYDAVRENLIHLQQLGMIMESQEKKVDYEEGQDQKVELNDGSVLVLKKLDSKLHDFTNRMEAINVINSARNEGKILTGLFYIDESKPALHEGLDMSPKGLTHLNAKDCRPSEESLKEILKEFV